MSKWFGSKKWLVATSVVAMSSMLLFTVCSDDKKDDYTLSGETDIGKWCDYGPIDGSNGGCYLIDAQNPCKIGATQGSVVNKINDCSVGSLPAQLCDYGFGNLVPMTANAEPCNQYGALVATDVILGGGKSSGIYCNFGSTSIYGNGGCFYRPSLESIPEDQRNNVNQYDSKYGEPEGDCDAWSVNVQMDDCIIENRDNPCWIGDPTNADNIRPCGDSCNPDIDISNCNN